MDNTIPASKIKNREPSQLLKQVSFYILLFFCIFIPFRNPIADLTTSGIKIITDLLVVAVFIWYSFEIRLRYKFYVQDFLFLAFLLVAFISTVFINHNGIGTYIFQVRSIGIYYIFYFVIRNFGYGKDHFIKVVRVLQYVSIPLFALGLIEKITSKTVLFPSSVADGIIYPSNFSRIYSMFYNPNTFGLFIMLTLFLTWIARIYFNKKTNIAFYCILFASLWFTMSRSSLIITAVISVAFLIFLIYNKRIKILYKTILKSAAIVLAVVIALHFGVNFATTQYYDNVIKPSTQQDNSSIQESLDLNFMDRLSETSDKAAVDSSQQDGRLFSLKTSLKVMKDYPIWGAGFGSFGSAASLNRESALIEKYGLFEGFYSDIEYAKVFAENGILGTALFFAFLISILIKNRKNFFKLFLCFIIGWFGFFFNIFEVQIGAMIFWSMLGFSDFIPEQPVENKKLKQKPMEGEK